MYTPATSSGVNSSVIDDGLVACPACTKQIQSALMNHHLDMECDSFSSSDSSLICTKQTKALNTNSDVVKGTPSNESLVVISDSDDGDDKEESCKAMVPYSFNEVCFHLLEQTVSALQRAEDDPSLFEVSVGSDGQNIFPIPHAVESDVSNCTVVSLFNLDAADSLASDIRSRDQTESTDLIKEDDTLKSLHQEHDDIDNELYDMKNNSDIDALPSSAPQERYFVKTLISLAEWCLADGDNYDDIHLSSRSLLFSEADLKIFNDFLSIGTASRILYARLLNRAPASWRVKKLCSSYAQEEGIGGSEGVESASKALIHKGLLEHASSRSYCDEASSITTLLRLLSATEILEIAKTMKIKVKLDTRKFSGIGKNEAMISLLTNWCKNQRSLSGGNMLYRLREYAEKQLGECVNLLGREAWRRALLLLILPEHRLSDMTMADQLWMLTQKSWGKLVYPAAVPWTRRPLFAHSAALTAFDDALTLDKVASVAFISGNINEITSIISEAKNHLIILASSTFIDFDTITCVKENSSNYEEKFLNDAKMATDCLLHYTPQWVYARILSSGVEALEKCNMYQEAVAILSLLLCQTLLLLDSRGRWFDRLALDVGYHLRSPDDALRLCNIALADPLVHTSHRLSLERRRNGLHEKRLRHEAKIRRRENKGAKCASSSHELEHSDNKGNVGYNTVSMDTKNPSVLTVALDRLEEVEIYADRLPTSSKSGGNVLYRVAECVVRVEEVVLLHYDALGWCGVHCEGGVLTTLFALCLWDIIFARVPDVFVSGFQEAPLDIRNAGFFKRRQPAIERRLKELEAGYGPRIIRAAHTIYRGQCAVGVQWKALPREEDFSDIAICLGGHALARICRLFACQYRHRSGGLPDLMLWKPSEAAIKFCEVKSENDRLSDKQRVWIAQLCELGIDVEVMRVRDNTGVLM